MAKSEYGETQGRETGSFLLERRQHWQVGAIRITKLVETIGAWSSTDLFPALVGGAAPAPAWMHAGCYSENGDLLLSVHTFVIDAPGCRVLVDTCVGNDKTCPWRREWHRRSGPFLETLELAGFPPDSIDVVVNTHLHPDHIGFNTRLVSGDWQPTFPRARYVIAEKEWAAFEDKNSTEARESLSPLLAHGVVDFVASDYQICAGVALFPSEGHTVGHVSVSIFDDNEQAKISGDVIHHPLQLVHPDWDCEFDADHSAANNQRAQFLEQCASEGTLLLATHFPYQSGGYIDRCGVGFSLRPPKGD